MPRRATPDWKEVGDLAAFSRKEWTDYLLHGLAVGDRSGQAALVGQLEKSVEWPLRRLRALEASLKQRFVEKDEIIEMVIVSAVAHQPMLLVGKPGTAKSKIVLKFCEGLGLGRVGEAAGHHTVFQYLLHAFTEPDEVLGPVDIEKLRADPPSFVRLRAGSITDAEVIFMDEVFRANSAILNALLSVINERQVYEGGALHPARARLIYGASNSTPTARQLDDLRAFYSRFIIRVESTFVSLEFSPEVAFTLTAQSLNSLKAEGVPADVLKALQPVIDREVRGEGGLQSLLRQTLGEAAAGKYGALLVRHANPRSTPAEARRRLLEEGWRNEVRELRAGYRPEGSALEQHSCLNDVLLLNRAMTEMWGGDDLSRHGRFLNHYHNLVQTLAGGEAPLCEIDDRKFVRLLAVLRAHALYTHTGPVDTPDLIVLRHVWDDLDNKISVQRKVNAFIDSHR